MITAVYVHSAPTISDHALIKRAVEGSDVISNAQLKVPGVLYTLKSEAKRS